MSRTVVAPSDRLPLLLVGQLRFAAELDAAGLCSLASFAAASADQIPLELGEAAQDSRHQPAVRRGGVSPCIAERSKPALRSAIAASVFNRSRVDRASWSS